MANEKQMNKSCIKCFLLITFVAFQAVTPVTMSRSLEGGGFADKKDYYSPPAHHHHDSHGSSSTPAPPTGGGSGYYNPPSTTPAVTTPPSPEVQPLAPPTGGGSGYYNPPSTTPAVTTPPSPEVQPLAPPTPVNPLLPPGIDPNCFPFTCNYWRTHPSVILTLLGYWCPLGQVFGLPNPTLFGSNPTFLDALSNTLPGGIGALYREGTAAYLNTLVNGGNFYYTSQQVRDAVNRASVSNEAAAAQAVLFQKANEGRLRRHN